MASVVEMVNLKTEKSFRDRQFRSRQQQQIPQPSRPLGGERRAKKADSAGINIIALSGESLLPIFDCNNCGGIHKSMNCKSDCRLCKSKGLDSNYIQFHCPKISNATEKKKNQLPRKATESAQHQSATSGPKKTAGSIVSAITQDDESFVEEDSEVRLDYPVWVDTCASDVYTQLKVEQAEGTILVSSGVGKLAGAPAYVMPDMSDTLLGANVVYKLGNIMLVDDIQILSNESTRAALTAFYDFIRLNEHLLKFTAHVENGCYKVLRSTIKTLSNKRNMAHIISRYETVQFSLYHFVRFWHEAMGHADIKIMLLIANRIVSHVQGRFEV